MLRSAFAGIVVGCVLAGPVAAQQPADAEPAVELSLDGAEAKVVGALFEKLGAAIGGGDPRAVLQHFDVSRLAEALAGVLPDDQAALVRQPAFAMGMEIALGRQLANDQAVWRWERCALRRLERRAGGVLVAYVRQWNARGVAELKRWWLASGGSGYRVFDVEPIEAGLRISQSMAAALPAARAGDHRVSQALKLMGEAFQTMLTGDLAGAREQIALLPDDVLPPAFDALRWMLLGAIAVGEEAPALALRHIAKARRVAADMPGLDLLEGQAQLQQEEWARADAAAVRYMAVVGLDPDALALRGAAARGRGDAAAAAGHFRAGLDDDPSSADCLLGLASVLPAGAKAEIGERYKRFPDPIGTFETIAVQLLQQRDGEGLGALVAGYRSAAPADPNGDYYGAEALLLQEQPAAAAAMIERSMDRAPDDEAEYYWDTYLHAMTAAGKALEGYARVPDALFAFHNVAERLWLEDQFGPLGALVEAHRARAPADGWLHFFQAEVVRAAGDSAEAERLHLRAFGALGDAVSLTPLVELRVSLGRWKDAYEGPADPDTMFPEVADALRAAKNGAALVELCDLHAKRAPTDVEVALWRAEGHALLGKHEAVLEGLRPHRARLQVDPDRVTWFEERWVRSLVALKQFDEALACASRSTARDGDPWFELFVYVGKGDAENTLRVMRALTKLGYDPAQWWADAELASALRGSAFGSVRAAFPEPAKD